VASNTKKTEKKRLAKARSSGRDRKRHLEREGSTRSEAELFGNVLAR